MIIENHTGKFQMINSEKRREQLKQAQTKHRAKLKSKEISRVEYHLSGRERKAMDSFLETLRGFESEI
jgi:hypothetical protein